jgi:hypothetical protein
MKLNLLELNLQKKKTRITFFSFSNEKLHLILEYKGILNGYKVSQSLEGISEAVFSSI